MRRAASWGQPLHERSSPRGARTSGICAVAMDQAWDGGSRCATHPWQDRGMPIPRFVGRFNKYVTNPLARLVAGWLPPFAVVVHRGRVSGRVYRTPVAAFRSRDGLVVALTYGAGADWVRNVLKDEGCTVRMLGRVREATGPVGERDDQAVPRPEGRHRKGR